MWDSVGIEALDGSSPSYVQENTAKVLAAPKHLPPVASKSYSVVRILSHSTTKSSYQSSNMHHIFIYRRVYGKRVPS